MAILDVDESVFFDLPKAYYLTLPLRTLYLIIIKRCYFSLSFLKNYLTGLRLAGICRKSSSKYVQNLNLR
jgi:hypothetical protein